MGQADGLEVTMEALKQDKETLQLLRLERNINWDPDICHSEGRKLKAILPDSFNFSNKVIHREERLRKGGGGLALEKGENSVRSFHKDREQDLAKER